MAKLISKANGSQINAMIHRGRPKNRRESFVSYLAPI